MAGFLLAQRMIKEVYQSDVSGEPAPDTFNPFLYNSKDSITQDESNGMYNYLRKRFKPKNFTYGMIAKEFCCCLMLKRNQYLRDNAKFKPHLFFHKGIKKIQ